VEAREAFIAQSSSHITREHAVFSCAAQLAQYLFVFFVSARNVLYVLWLKNETILETLRKNSLNLACFPFCFGARVCLASVSVDDVSDVINVGAVEVPDAKVLRMIKRAEVTLEVKTSREGFSRLH